MTDAFTTHALELDKLKPYLAEYALTDMARERIHALRPITSAETIAQILDETEEIADLLRYDDPFPIDGLQDLRGRIKKVLAAGSYLNPDDLHTVRRTLTTVQRLKAYVHARRQKYPRLLRRTDALRTYPDLMDAIQRCLDDAGELKDDASPALRRIRREMVQRAAEVRKTLESLARRYVELEYTSEPVITLRGGRMVIPVKEAFKNVVKGFIHDESASGQTVFIEPAEVLAANNALRKLSLDEAREIERILIAVADLIRLHAEELSADLDGVGYLEFLYVKGRFANRIQAAKPRLNTDGQLVIRNGYHPLLRLKDAPGAPPVVPLQLEIGTTYRTLIISGPNAGGKTVALKTAGLFVLMTQSGLLIPAEPGTLIGVFESVLADIGDDQSIENDLSTFSSHIRNLAAMVDRVSPRTLILIDEIGSGTDPGEGASLAIAILEYLHSRGAVSIVTTHHSELKAFANDTDGVENGSMAFDHATLRPTYVFRPGIPGSSYAMEISRRIGLREDVIRRAQTIAGSDAQRLEKLIATLQAQAKRYDDASADLAREKARLDGAEQDLTERRDALRKQETAQKKKAAEAKKQMLAEAGAQIQKLLDDLRKAPARSPTLHARKTIQEELGTVNAELDALGRAEDAALEPAETVTEGQRVIVREMGLEGTVLSGPDPDGRVRVAIGRLRMTVMLSQLALRRSQDGTAAPPAAASRVDWNTDNVTRELDVRGRTAEEALQDVDAYLGSARSLGFVEVTIIHGKGNGVLRKKIGAFLKTDRRVAQHRLGQWGEGDTGVTIVTLKTS